MGNLRGQGVILRSFRLRLRISQGLHTALCTVCAWASARHVLCATGQPRQYLLNDIAWTFGSIAVLHEGFGRCSNGYTGPHCKAVVISAVCVLILTLVELNIEL